MQLSKSEVRPSGPPEGQDEAIDTPNTLLPVLRRSPGCKVTILLFYIDQGIAVSGFDLQPSGKYNITQLPH